MNRKQEGKQGILRAAMGVLAAVCMLQSSAIPARASDRKVEPVYLARPKHAWWETDTTAHWSTVSKAHEYQVKLYLADYVDMDYDEDDYTWTFEEDDDLLECVAMIRTGDTRYDFSPYMNDLHSYFYVVRSTPRVSEQAYVVSSSWKVSPENDFREKQTQGITTGKWRNYPEGSRYDTGEGEFLPDGWQLIRGTWYYLADGGYRQSGWLDVDGARYRLGERGEMATGWFMIGDDWYYADKHGVVQKGWVMPEPGKYYYLNDDYTMAKDTVAGGYYVNESGLRMQPVDSGDPGTEDSDAPQDQAAGE